MPDLSRILEPIENEPEFQNLLGKLENGEKATLVVLDAARPYLTAALYRRLRRPLLLVTAQPENARKVHEQLHDWCPSDDLLVFPEPDALPYERLASDIATEIQRVHVLSALTDSKTGDSSGNIPFVITSAPAIMGKLPDAEEFTSLLHTIELGTEIDPLALLRRWESMGYRPEDVVEMPGTMSRRGGIVDIFPATSERPVRLEFFGNTIDSIRFFDTGTQRSVEKVASIAVGPASELLAPRSMDRWALEQTLKLDMTGCTNEVKQQFRHDTDLFLEGQSPREVQFYAPLFNKDSLMGYLPSNALIIIDELSSVEQAVEDFDAEAAQLRSEKLERGELPRDFPVPYFD